VFSYADAWKLYLLAAQCRSVDLRPGGWLSNVMLANALASMTENTRRLSVLNGAQDILTSALDAGGRDPADYAEGISFGISKALCLGRGNRGVKMTLEGVQGGVARGDVIVGVDLTGFTVGRDGSWCLYIDSQMSSCIRQPSLKLRLNWADVGCSSSVRLEVMVRGNVYQNDVMASDPAVVWVEEEAGLVEAPGGKDWVETKEIVISVGDKVICGGERQKEEL